MEEPVPCIYCTERLAEPNIIENERGYKQHQCPMCGACGPLAKSVTMALQAYNTRAPSVSHAEIQKVIDGLEKDINRYTSCGRLHQLLDATEAIPKLKTLLKP